MAEVLEKHDFGGDVSHKPDSDEDLSPYYNSQEQLRGSKDAQEQPKNSSEFVVWFNGIADLQEDVKARLKRLAHEEFYFERMSKRAPDNASNAELRQEMEAAGGPLNIRLVVVCVDENNRAGTFSRNMKDLEKFLSGSRKKFLTDAIAELSALGGIKSEFGEPVSTARFHLCMALVKAQALDELRDHKLFDADNAKALTELCTDPNLAAVFRNVEKKLPTGKAGNEVDRLVYDGRADRDRDRGGESRGG